MALFEEKKTAKSSSDFAAKRAQGATQGQLFQMPAIRKKDEKTSIF
jgi:hypothetical protein